jgi:uncharacterized membrane protein
MIYLTGIIIFIFGIFAGFIGSLTGLGGGTILTPLLTIFLNFPLYYSIGLSLLSTISTSISSFYLLNYLLYLILVFIPFTEVIIEQMKYAKEENKLYTLLSSIVIINLIIGIAFLPTIL